jgi:hypothetical protein
MAKSDHPRVAAHDTAGTDDDPVGPNVPDFMVDGWMPTDCTFFPVRHFALSFSRVEFSLKISGYFFG